MVPATAADKPSGSSRATALATCLATPFRVVAAAAPRKSFDRPNRRVYQQNSGIEFIAVLAFQTWNGCIAVLAHRSMWNVPTVPKTKKRQIV